MYGFTFLSLAIFSFIDCFSHDKYRKALIFMLFIAFFWLVFHDGFRWGIATDWVNYYKYFISCLSTDNSEYEIGYTWLNKGIRYLTDNYSLFLILHATLVYIVSFKLIKKYSPYPLFSVFILYFSMLTYLGMNRQYIALIIMLYSVNYILNRNLTKFTIFTCIAFLFHHSAILFFPAYFLNKKISNKFMLIGLGVSIIISLSGIVRLIPSELFFFFGDDFGNKMDFYKGFLNPSITSIILGISKRLIWIILLIALRNRISDDNKFSTFLNIYFVSVIVYVIFSGSIFQIVVARGLIYYNWFEILLLPYIFFLSRGNAIKIPVFFLICLYGYFTMEKNMNFYKEDLGYDIYRPYNSVLINPNYNAYE